METLIRSCLPPLTLFDAKLSASELTCDEMYLARGAVGEVRAGLATIVGISSGDRVRQYLSLFSQVLVAG